MLTGVLRLYEASTGRRDTIETKQADSETLLVEGQTVYYRVSDRLYVARLGAKSMESARLLATSELIRDAHWAFIQR